MLLRRSVPACIAACFLFAATACGGSGHSAAYGDGYSAGQNLEHTLGYSAGPSRSRCLRAAAINRNQSSDAQSNSTSSSKGDYVAGCIAGWKKAAGTSG